MAYAASHGSNAEVPAGVGARRDYNAEGKRLIASLGVRPAGGRYNPMDAVWKDEKTGGSIWVGNEVAAHGPASALAEAGITHVVNCTDDMPNFCESDPRISYLRFNVQWWQSGGDLYAKDCSDEGVLRFVQTLFDFVDGALASGGSVLVHCLAGAHRAGTTGCLLLMYKSGLGAAEATRVAKQLRPVINPIGGLPMLLQTYERVR